MVPINNLLSKPIFVSTLQIQKTHVHNYQNPKSSMLKATNPHPHKYLGIQKLQDVELLIEGRAVVVDHVLAMAILVASFVTWGCGGAPWFPNHFKLIKFASTFDFVRNLMVCGWRCSKYFPSS
jgi:hypothetical protein